MQVVEKFVSINGEGTRAGELAVFIRFKGCNLRCSYCDTMWANEHECEYEEMSPDEIYAYIKDTGVINITLTGGEPMLQKQMEELLYIFSKDTDIRVEIETNGAVDLGKFCNDCRPVFTMDYKLPSSLYEDKMIPDNFRLLESDDTVKFVIGSKEDLVRAHEILTEYNLVNKCNVYFSPVFGKIEPAEMVDYMIQNKLNKVRLQIQMHKIIWDPEKRGV